MIWSIIKKELHNNLLTFRFTFGTLILLLLVLAISFACVENIKDLQQEYTFAVQKNENELKESRVYCSIKYNTIKPPEVLSILNLGAANHLGNSVPLSLREIPSAAKKYSQVNPLLNIFPALDLTLVYKIVISLLAMLFAFDSISGEKEKGTLRLFLAQRVSRFTLLLGKYLGNMLTLSISFVLSLFVAFLIIIFNFPDISAGYWLRIILFAFLTLFYISVFFILGLIVSSLTKKSSVSLIFCLFIWIFLVIIIPNLSTYLSTVLRSIPLEKTVKSRINVIHDQMQEKIGAWEKINRVSIRISGSLDSDNGIYELTKADKTTIDYFKKKIAFEEPLFRKKTSDSWEVKQDYYRRLKKQENLAVVLNRISPLGLYHEASEMIALTATSNYENFIRQGVRYFETIYSHLESKDIFRSLRYFTVLEEKNILPVEEYRKVSKQWPGDMSAYPALDLSDFPRFEYQEEGLAETFSKILVLLIVFLLINLVLFTGAVFFFNSYDAR